MPTYSITDRDGRQICTVPLVLAPVELSGLETSSGQNIVTVASTANLYPGMPVAFPNIPAGAFIHSIKDSTTIELMRSVFTAGAWSTSTANAQATASAAGMTGHAYGYHHACHIELAYAMGMWRNLHSSNTNNGSPSILGALGESVAHQTFGIGVALVPTAGAWGSGLYGATNADIRVSDTLAATPAKRDNGERWGYRPFVQTAGAVSNISARPDWSVVLTNNA